MTPEIDHMRQRTVAELLAEHGNGGAGGRRRRRRSPDGPPGVAPTPPVRGLPASPPGGSHYGPRRPDAGSDQAILAGPAAGLAPREGLPGAPSLRPTGSSMRPPNGHRGEPIEMHADRFGPGGPDHRRGGVDSGAAGYAGPNGTGHVGAAGFGDEPGRAAQSPGVLPVARNGPGRGVGPAGGGSGPLRAVPPAGGSGPHRAVPPDSGFGPMRAAPPGVAHDTLWSAPSTTPGGVVPAFLHGAPPPPRERPGAAVPAPPLEQPPAWAGPREASGVGPPGRDQAPRPPGANGRRVPDPGPQTGAWDPFALDDEVDEPGLASAGGGDDRGPGAPRPTPRDDAYAEDVDRRPGPRPLAALRRTPPAQGEEPSTDAVDVGRRRSGFGGVWRPHRASGAVAPLGAPAIPRIRADQPTALTNGEDPHDRSDVRGDVRGGVRRDAPAPQRETSQAEPDDPSDGDLRVDPRGVPATPDGDPDGLPASDTDDADDADDFDDPLDDAFDDEPRPAQAWAGVVAQWLAGAVVGAVLWVLFRYLWRGLPVVALAAALLVTAGLVLAVRQLLHDVGRRATAFAVLVGLLLTASPAVLVLLGR